MDKAIFQKHCARISIVLLDLINKYFSFVSASYWQTLLYHVAANDSHRADQEAQIDNMSTKYWEI